MIGRKKKSRTLQFVNIGVDYEITKEGVVFKATADVYERFASPKVFKQVEEITTEMLDRMNEEFRDNLPDELKAFSKGEPTVLRKEWDR